jgi:hypothetical protein
MNATNWEVEAASDVYDAGTNEDGEMMEGLSFYLVATAPNGRRFVHSKRFNSPSRNRLEQAKSDIRYLLARVKVAQAMGNWAGPVGNAHWNEVDPAYGSEAYAANWVAIEADRKELENR